MSITAQAIKALRDKTSAGMMDCKKALQESNGDMEKAVDWLRQKGLSKAAKRADRVTTEGLIGCQVSADGKEAVMVEVRCETDFVSRGDKFRSFVADCTRDFAASGLDEVDKETVQDKIHDAVVVLGENINIGKSCRMKVHGAGVLGKYIHTNGKIGVLVEVNCGQEASADSPVLADLAKNIAMQIAAANPIAVSSDKVAPELIERERDVYRQKARADGKPENIIEKIAEGAIKKYFKDVCLLDQPYIRDDKTSIAELIKQCGKEIGDNLSVGGFVRIQLGA